MQVNDKSTASGGYRECTPLLPLCLLCSFNLLFAELALIGGHWLNDFTKICSRKQGDLLYAMKVHANGPSHCKV